MNINATSRLTIRKFNGTNSDYANLAVVEQLVWPEYPNTSEELQHHDNHCQKSGLFFQRLVAEIDDQVVAHCSYGDHEWALKEGRIFFDISVAPDYQCHGIGENSSEPKGGDLHVNSSTTRAT